jgi:Protein of unknown function (DUF3108)
MVHSFSRILWATVVVCAGLHGMAGAGEKKKKSTETVPWISAVEGSTPGEFPMLGPASFTYVVSWNGVFKAGEARIAFRSEGAAVGADVIETCGTSRSLGPARVLWPYDFKVTSRVELDRLLPMEVEQWEEDRSEENVYRTTFTPGVVQNVWITKPKKDGQADEERQRVFRHEPVHDMVSAMLYVRSLPWDKPGGSVSLIVFPFRDPYLVTLTLAGKEKHKRGDEAVDTLKFALGVSKICKDGTLEPISKQMKSAQFWVTDDALRLPLEMRAEIFVGSIRVTLADYELSPGDEIEPGRASGVKEASADQTLSGAVETAKKWWGKGRP